jgi:hypothetical protein
VGGRDVFVEGIGGLVCVGLGVFVGGEVGGLVCARLGELVGREVGGRVCVGWAVRVGAGKGVWVWVVLGGLVRKVAVSNRNGVGDSEGRTVALSVEVIATMEVDEAVPVRAVEVGKGPRVLLTSVQVQSVLHPPFLLHPRQLVKP